MRFVIDEQLPEVLCKWLRDRGHDALHVAEVGLSGAEDFDVWAVAMRETSALMTKDEDFVAMRLSAQNGPPVVWLRIGNATNPVLFTWLSVRLDAVLDAIERGEAIIEVR